MTLCPSGLKRVAGTPRCHSSQAIPKQPGHNDLLGKALSSPSPCACAAVRKAAHPALPAELSPPLREVVGGAPSHFAGRQTALLFAFSPVCCKRQTRTVAEGSAASQHEHTGCTLWKACPPRSSSSANTKVSRLKPLAYKDHVVKGMAQERINNPQN